jgi:hypothetical protein
MKNEPITKEQIQALKNEPTVKGRDAFIVTGKHPNRKQRRMK